MGLYVFSLPNSLLMVERIYCFVLLSSSNRKYELLSIGLGHETMLCAVCLFIFLWWNTGLKASKNEEERILAVSAPVIGKPGHVSQGIQVLFNRHKTISLCQCHCLITELKWTRRQIFNWARRGAHPSFLVTGHTRTPSAPL